MDITPAQCRAARALVDLKQAQLGKLARVSARTIGMFEAGERSPCPSVREALKRALESTGVEFTGDGGVRPKLERHND